MAYVLVAIIFSVAGVLLGYVVKGRELNKIAPVVKQYLALTKNSKRYIDGLIHARMVHDERTTYRERKK